MELAPFKFKTKQQLLAALNERLAAAIAHDAAQEKQHRKDEAAYLKFFRARLREAMSLDYAQAKARGFRVVGGKWSGEHIAGSAIPEIEKPVCPPSDAVTVRRAIELVERWTDASFPARGLLMIRSVGRYQFLHGVLSRSYDRRPADVCGA